MSCWCIGLECWVCNPDLQEGAGTQGAPYTLISALEARWHIVDAP